MKGVEVDAEARTARVGAGVLWGELDAATQEHGLATVGGIVTHTGVAGLTLGGGIGWLQRKHGLTIDQLVSVDLVTAAGDERHGQRGRRTRSSSGASAAAAGTSESSPSSSSACTRSARPSLPGRCSGR